MEGGGGTAEQRRLPLSVVVSDCIKRWFQDTLKEAKAGDINMQGRIWITRASRIRSSAWKLSNKRPGYNASDSDSDEVAGDS
ncbi:hypothetical protein BUALT_Bualt11G0135000 [Buddleja alternifolia]|uniref:Uncharacterized protein n=1 Tax=Buddleja alternifolia TaxID=168488 RepID=A0AAV6WZL0_9LAMI|nr:hypothetical protein BUALT_Bualt11G0135000 [Buddleja alternifolia]